MNTQILTTRNLAIATALALAVVLWQAELRFATMILVLVTTGLAMARPTFHERRLRLEGTPVLLLFAFMFVAASGMVTAVDRVGALFESDTASECGADMPATVRVLGELTD